MGAARRPTEGTAKCVRCKRRLGCTYARLNEATKASDRTAWPPPRHRADPSFAFPSVALFNFRGPSSTMMSAAAAAVSSSSLTHSSVASVAVGRHCDERASERSSLLTHSILRAVVTRRAAESARPTDGLASDRISAAAAVANNHFHKYGKRRCRRPRPLVLGRIQIQLEGFCSVASRFWCGAVCWRFSFISKYLRFLFTPLLSRANTALTGFPFRHTAMARSFFFRPPPPQQIKAVRGGGKVKANYVWKNGLSPPLPRPPLPLWFPSSVR